MCLKSVIFYFNSKSLRGPPLPSTKKRVKGDIETHYLNTKHKAQGKIKTLLSTSERLRVGGVGGKCRGCYLKREGGSLTPTLRGQHKKKKKKKEK